MKKEKSNRDMWKCTYKLKWPYEADFSSTMRSKLLATNYAALKGLDWLQIQGKLTRNVSPRLYYPRDVKKIIRIPADVTIDPALMPDLDKLITYYHKHIAALIDNPENSERMSECSDNWKSDDDNFKEEEDSGKVERLVSKKSVQNPKIIEFKSEILKKVEENNVLVIKGETGCGKSTQVPQYIMEQWESAQKGSECNIIITQPRRISAISLANRVAQERQEMVGDVVGYQVRLKSVLPRPPGGALLFCSTGILLRRLQSNLGLFGASHIILDEAHERDISTDMLLVLLRRALSLNPDLRLIIMSATINAEVFQEYFGNAPMLSIPGFTYPVKSVFLEDLQFEIEPYTMLEHPVIDCDLVANTINWIDKNRPEGAILCFLPGWAQISNITTILKNKRYWVLPAHSKLNHKDQHNIFEKPPFGYRKIILSTNIAETSLTINDVKYVVDAGAHKEERLNMDLGMSSLANHWISKANVSQRKGRAGRVQPGECFHLYTREKYESLDQFPMPEVLRVSLEKTVLDLKTYSPYEKAKDFLSEMPEPSKVEAISQAVNELYQLGALDENERLTPLGRRIALFSTHPKLSKALVLSAIFRCVSPMLTIATVLSGEEKVFKGSFDNKGYIRMFKKQFHPSSDHISIAWIYQQWEAIHEKNHIDACNYCDDNNLSNYNLILIQKLRKLYSDHLWQSEMLDDSEEYKDLSGPRNKYAGNDELVKAIFLSGTGTLLYKRRFDDKGCLVNKNVLITEGGQHTALASESVNFKRENFPSPYVTYFRQSESSERRIVVTQDTSVLSPLTVLLFSNGECQVSEFKAPSFIEAKLDNHMLLKAIRNGRKMHFLCDKSVVYKLLDFREIIWNMINYFIKKNGKETDDVTYKTISSYHNDLLRTLSCILYDSGATIEYNKDGYQ
ncbi:hypothetical protein L9F63_023008, partial [Diploptera punctata]